METYQRNIHVEGTIGSNSLIEGLNTKIFEDIGLNNNIIIEVKGYKNGKSNLDVINSYEQIKNIPIQIIKKGDMNGNTLTFKISNLNAVNLSYKDENNNITSDFSSFQLKNKDKMDNLHILFFICFAYSN